MYQVINSSRELAESLDSRLKQGDWWQKDNECLCLQDINKPPVYFEGSEWQWIEEVTAYQYSYPVQWQEIYKEYLDRAEQAGNVNRTILEFRRSEDGYLRKKGENDVYLKIKGVEPVPYIELDQMGAVLLKHAEEMVSSYLESCGLDEQKRINWKEMVKEKIVEWVSNADIMVSFEETLDESDFSRDELYFDWLNNLYIIL